MTSATFWLGRSLFAVFSQSAAGVNSLSNGYILFLCDWEKIKEYDKL